MGRDMNEKQWIYAMKLYDVKQDSIKWKSKPNR